MFRARPDEYLESRARLGVSMERAYHQPTPMGDFVVAYMESEGPGPDTLAKIVTSDLSIDKEFIRLVNEIHGIDLTVPPSGPPPDTVGVWVDPDMKTRGRGLAFCAPLLTGAEDAGRKFATEAFQTRADEMTASRRALGQTVEVVTLQATPHGAITAVYLEGTDPVEGNRKLAASTEPFDLWFKAELAKLYPPEIDFSKPIPPVSELFDSQAVGLH